MVAASEQANQVLSCINIYYYYYYYYLDNNANRQFSKYRYLLNDLASKYYHVKFVNLSIGSLGIFGQSFAIRLFRCVAI